MGQPSNSEIVLLRWPFSNKAGGKRRPGLILCQWDYETRTDLLVALVTTKEWDKRAIRIPHEEVVEGELLQQSWIRPSQLFTVDTATVSQTVAKLSPVFHAQVIEATIRHILESGNVK